MPSARTGPFPSKQAPQEISSSTENPKTTQFGHGLGTQNKKKTAVTIRLTKGRFALVDVDDEKIVRAYSWFTRIDRDGHYYAHAWTRRVDGKRREISMHRLLMDAVPGQIVDHINGDGLDNRRSCNLRLCTNKENSRNARLYKNKTTSGLRGVSFIKSLGRFRAQIMCDGKKINLGSFLDETTAAFAYDEAAKRLFGAFARVNFPDAKPSESCLGSVAEKNVQKLLADSGLSSAA